MAEDGCTPPGKSSFTDAFASAFLLSANQNDIGFDFVVAGNGGTAVMPLSIELDVLVQREFGLSNGILLGFA